MATQSIYENIVEAKSGDKVPVFTGGKPANSLYDPWKEAGKLFPRPPSETFAVFAGLADGKRIKLFLDSDIKNECIVIEKNQESIDFLMNIPESEYIIKNARVKLIEFDRNKHAFSEILSGMYIPALFKNFTLDILQSWKNFCPDEAEWILKETEKTLQVISKDFSTQSHFGKIWLSNFVKNIFKLQRTDFPLKALDNNKTAFIVAAGPSLEKDMAAMKKERGSIYVFSTDTACPVLFTEGIVPDFIVSIDPQHASARHFMRNFRLRKKNGQITKKPVLIMDICGNPAAAETTLKRGDHIIFAAGGHPVAKYLAETFPMPELSTYAGTVTASAMDAARRLGFSKIKTAGADFAYTEGKPYSRGTYFENQFFSATYKLLPGETMYAALMFRTEVTKTPGKNGSITYRTPVLDGYRHNTGLLDTSPEKWTEKDFQPFSPEDFLRGFYSTLKKLAVKIESGYSTNMINESLNKDEKGVFVSILPLAAFFRKKNPLENREKILKMTINLALNIIEGYTHII